MTRIIGLISGTSVDGIDAALMEISGRDENLQVELLAGETYPYPAALRSQILAVCGGAALSMAELAELDDEIANQFAQAALTIQPNHVNAELIGSHGQTVYHQSVGQEQSSSPSALGYSLQLGRGALIAHLTGIPTVSNFRAADIAVGGQGAPLVSRVDACLLSHSTLNRCIQNIGGIGNVTYLPAKTGLGLAGALGWDTGPGNVLLDLAVQTLSTGEQTYDQNGAWAAQGRPCHPLIEQWLKQNFFQQLPPKSTGRELFGPLYLQQCLEDAAVYGLGTADILATLTEFTAATIVHSYQHFLPCMPDQILLCGGGSRNLYLRQRLQALFDSIPVLTTTELGLSGDFKEAIAFGVLAYWQQQSIPGNLPKVTGARRAVPLGEYYAVGSQA